MTVIGITGPSGAGKGMASQILKNKYGFSVIDADEVYHELVSKPSECLEEIKNHFGESVIKSDGTLDRSELRKYVFGKENKENLLLLNSITHKHVVIEIKKTISNLAQTESVCIIDAPLLIEAGMCPMCDFTISVIADNDIRAKRIAMRDSIGLDEAMLRISSQKDDEYYISNTSFFVKNNGNLNELAASLDKTLHDGGILR